VNPSDDEKPDAGTRLTDVAAAEEAPRRHGEPRFQFTLRDLFLVMTLVAILCGLFAWLGVIAWILLAATVGALVGLLAGILMGLETQIDDIRVDLAKCFVAAAFLVIPAWLMIKAGLAGGGLVAPVVVTGLVLKASWRDFAAVEIVVVEGCMLLGIALGSTLAAAVLGA
jgi:hypothetical protein